jgi:hypothetical protein
MRSSASVADSGAVVVDHDLDLAAHAAAGEAHLVAGRRRMTVRSRRRLETICPSRESWPVTAKLRRSGRGPRNAFRRATSWPSLVSLATEVERGQQAAQIDRDRRVVALEFGIETAGVGDVRDQAGRAACTSCSITCEQAARGCSRCFASGNVSTAERNEVNGFFNSCATSAANISIASMRLYSASGHVAQRTGEMPNLVATTGEVRESRPGS